MSSEPKQDYFDLLKEVADDGFDPENIGEVFEAATYSLAVLVRSVQIMISHIAETEKKNLKVGSGFVKGEANANFEASTGEL